jgi:hypothetical protein
LASVRHHVARFLGVRPQAVVVEQTGQLPRTASCKIDFRAVATWVADPAPTASS